MGILVLGGAVHNIRLGILLDVAVPTLRASLSLPGLFIACKVK